jgi:hypothetical protein
LLSLMRRLAAIPAAATPAPPHLNARGAGIYFGPNVTHAFCALNNVSLVVRSHECVQEGYAFMHERRLMTIFSASHYCARDTNRGAYIACDAALGHVIQQFVAAPLLETAPREAAVGGGTAALASEAPASPLPPAAASLAFALSSSSPPLHVPSPMDLTLNTATRAAVLPLPSTTASASV